MCRGVDVDMFRDMTALHRTTDALGRGADKRAAIVRNTIEVIMAAVAR